MITIETFVHILDLGGTFVFAISGAVAAVNRRLDIFGILVLSFVAGNFGGIGRDVLIGAVPPAALSDGRYLLVSVLAGLITFFSYAGVNRLRNPVLLFDAVGLSFFAVAGAQKAITFGLSPVMSALLGMLTGIGGGMTRDVLLTEIPQVLRSAAFASWRSGMACNCRSLIFRRNDAPKRIPRMIRESPRMIRESNELHSATTGRVVPTRRSNRVTIFTAVHFVGLWPLTTHRTLVANCRFRAATDIRC